jgi:hypothetical protein
MSGRSRTGKSHKARPEADGSDSPKTSTVPPAVLQRINDLIQDGCYVEFIAAEDDGRELGLVMFGMTQLIEICEAGGIKNVTAEDISRWLARTSQRRTGRLAGVAGHLFHGYHEERDARRHPEPVVLEDAEIHKQQLDDWTRGLDWLALHAEFSRPAKEQLGLDYVALASDANDLELPSQNPDDLSLGDYLARAAQTGNAAAIDAFCRWSRTSVGVARREHDWPTILLAYRAEFEALKQMARERETDPDNFPRSETTKRLLAELGACGFDEASVFGHASRAAPGPRRRLAELARVLVAKRYNTTPKAIEQKWRKRRIRPGED